MLQNTAQNNRDENSRGLNCIVDKLESEMHHKFQNPIVKKPAVTRAKRLEQFLWHEFYDEYIRSKERLEVLPSGNQTTEYIDEYGQAMQNHKEINVHDEGALAKDYPLYANEAITFWNPKGQDNNFGKTLSITLDVAQQQGQFG